MWEIVAAGMSCIVLVLMGLLGVVYSGLKGIVDRQGESLTNFGEKLTEAIGNLDRTIKAVESEGRKELQQAIEEMGSNIKEHEKKLEGLSGRIYEGQALILGLQGNMSEKYMPVADIKNGFQRVDDKFEKLMMDIKDQLRPLPEMNTKLVMLSRQVDEMSKRGAPAG